MYLFDTISNNENYLKNILHKSLTKKLWNFSRKLKVDDYLIKQLVQLQEKLCESFGRRRQKIAIGIYSYDKIKFPVHYKATSPESIRFIPLEYKKEMTQQEILEEQDRKSV